MSVLQHCHFPCIFDDTSISLIFNCYLFFMISDLQLHSFNCCKVAFGEDVERP